jgi:hypothetical protein
MKKSEKIKQLGDSLNAMQLMLLASETERLEYKEKLDYLREILNDSPEQSFSEKPPSILDQCNFSAQADAFLDAINKKDSFQQVTALSKEDSIAMLMQAGKSFETISFYGNNLYVSEFEVSSTGFEGQKTYIFTLSNGSLIVI